MKLVIDIHSKDYQFLKETSFVEDPISVINQSSEDRSKTLTIFRLIDAVRDGMIFDETDIWSVEV